MNYRAVLVGFSQNRIFKRVLSRGGNCLSRRWRLSVVAHQVHGAIETSIAGNILSVIPFPLKTIELKTNGPLLEASVHRR